jgi:sortase A
MFNKRQDLDKVSVIELEQLLHIKRRQARQERFIRLYGQGESSQAALLSEEVPVAPTAQPAGSSSPVQPGTASQAGLSHIAITPAPPSRGKKVRDLILLAVEVGAIVGLIVVLVSSYLNLRTLNDEVVEAQNTSRLNQVVAERLFSPAAPVESQPRLAYERLPGGHSSPTAPGGAVPDIPAHLQNWVQPLPSVPVPEQALAEATRIVIPKINVDAPIVQGVAWEDLKKGVGHLPGSARPGERGNLYLAAHNDIYGEIFRYLEKLEPGDEYYIYAGEEMFTYVVREKRIIEPTEVSVMLPTTEPVATLQTCYPYLIDTHRLVVISDLVN